MGIRSTSLATADESARKRELRAFLMSRRARLQPHDVGLADTRRRRTPGLRREEVAALAGLSTAWYTLFEMAKETRVSRKTLDAVARALKLSPSETRHLYVLANAVGPAPVEGGRDIADPVLQLILDGYRTGPALLLNDRTDVLALNDIAVEVFGKLSAAQGFERNLLWLLFANKEFIEDWEDQARHVAALFRAAYCEHAQEAEYNDLLVALQQRSAAFERYWLEHDVRPFEAALELVFNHPTLGRLHFAFRALPLTNGSDLRCGFFVPAEDTLQNAAYRRILTLPP